MARNTWVRVILLSVTVGVIAGWLYQFQDALSPFRVNSLSPSSVLSADPQQLAREVAPDLSTTHPNSVEIGENQDVQRPPPSVVAQPVDPSLALEPYHVMYQGLTIAEVERGDQFSRLASEIVLEGPAHPTFLQEFEGDLASEIRHVSNMNYIWELACLRDYSHYFVLAEQDGPGFLVFFTNDENTPITTLLGDQYSANAQRQFDAVGYRRAWHSGRGGQYCLVNPRDSSSLTRAQ